MRNNPPPESDREAPEEYIARVNHAIDYILQNLDRPLALEDVAREACFSRFHFHRIFRTLVGETLQQFILRLRLERALSMLTYQRERNLTEIAFACGFSSSSDFSRVFKRRFGLPPSAIDIDLFRERGRQKWIAAAQDSERRRVREGLPPGANPDGFEVELRELPARCVAYVRVMDSFQEGRAQEAIERLMAWAEPRGLADGQWLGYMWDDPEVVAAEHCRYDVGLEVPEFRSEGEIGRFDFPPMLVAQLELKGSIDLEVRALDWLFKTWLPDSGYAPAELPCFEAWIGRPFQHGHEYFEIHAQIPVVRL